MSKTYRANPDGIIRLFAVICQCPGIAIDSNSGILAVYLNKSGAEGCSLNGSPCEFCGGKYGVKMVKAQFNE